MKLSFVITVAVFCGMLSIEGFAKEKSPPPYDKTISDAQALDISEATFRFQFLNNASGVQQKADSYFLSLFGKDPSPDFLKRFSKHKPPVGKSSEFKVGDGLKFHVTRIKRIDQTKVEVSGGYYEANLSASGCTYIVELKDGKWVVIKRTLNVIS